MPRKKKVVNELLNHASQEQDLSINKVDHKEEIKESKVEPIAKKSTRKWSKIKTDAEIEAIYSRNNKKKIEQVKLKNTVQPEVNVDEKEEIKNDIVSETIMVKPEIKSEDITLNSEMPLSEKIEDNSEKSKDKISPEKNDRKKFNRNKKKVNIINNAENIISNTSNIEIKTNESKVDSKMVESQLDIKNNVNIESQENIENKVETNEIKNEKPLKTSEKSYADIPDIGIKVNPSDIKTEGKKFNKWDKKKKYNQNKLENKDDILAESKIQPEILINIEKPEILNQINENIIVESPKIDTVEISASESVKNEDVKEEKDVANQDEKKEDPVEIKQEEKKKSKNKKKKKNKKDKVENSPNSDTTEIKGQALPQPKQVEKKLEAPKVIRKPEPEIVITINPKKMLTKEQEKNPFLIKFFNQLEDFLRKEVQIEKGQKLLVAMSGGVDSSVLFDALSILSFKMKFVIYVLHFNHKLRGLSSERDEKLVNQLSKDYNVQYFNASGNVKQFAERNSLSIEYAARQLRYNFFEKVARTLNANFVATAHTADDNVETFFLNLFRGSGLTGLSGIPAKRNLVKNVMMLRPLITFRKKELLEYAKIRRLKWFEDETNSLLNYTRNKIRLSLIPRLEEEFNPSITDIINQTAKLMSGADRLIRDIVKKNYPLVVEDASQEKFTIKLPMLMANEEFIQGEIIQYLWLKYFRLQPLPMQTINRILNLHTSQTGAICEINSMYFVLKDRNNLIFTKRQYEENIKLLVSIPGKYFIGRYKIEFTEVDRSEVVLDDNPNIEFFDSSIMESFLEIRNWQMGDTFQPLGMKGDMKVSDFLINEKVPITEKASIIVLTNKTEIIWIVGKRISDKFKIKKNSEKVIKAVIVKNEKK